MDRLLFPLRNPGLTLYPGPDNFYRRLERYQAVSYSIWHHTTSVSAFIGTDLMQVLEEIGSTELVVCGVHLQDCVESTVRMAGNLGFMVYLVGDATVSLGQTDINGKKWSADEVHALTLGILDGQYAKVMNSGDLMIDTEGAVVH